ncbi:MAG TPA: OmpA family protein [Burkholderiales bacterium]|nr:OmpA family protein [Burkholderiales bacterium]
MRTNDRPDRVSKFGALCCAAVLALLTACQTAPPQAPPTPAAEMRVETLRALGFVEGTEGWMLSLSVPILFDLNRDELKPETRKAVGELADSLLRAGIRRVRVEGHTDNYGGRDYNIRLSRRRAEAVARELAAHGFAEGAITRQAWGFEYPAAPNDTSDGRALNRRVTIVVLPAELASD